MHQHDQFRTSYVLAFYVSIIVVKSAHNSVTYSGTRLWPELIYEMWRVKFIKENSDMLVESKNCSLKIQRVQ